MQFPETFGMPVATIQFGAMGVPIPPTGPPPPIGVCDELPGQLFARRQCHESRDDEARINQALELFNNKFVLERVKASNPDGILAKSLSLTDEQLVNKLFAAVLSRPSSESEKNLVLSNLKKGSRTEQAENLLWTLYNKVDFIYNY